MTTTLYTRIGGPVLLTIILGAFQDGYARAEGAVSLATIREAWAVQESHFPKVHFEANAKEFAPRGAKSRGVPPEFLNHTTLPPEDTTFECVYRVSIDGNKTRHSYTQYDWDFDLRKYFKGEFRTSFDGVKGRLLIETGMPKEKHSGSIRPGAQYRETYYGMKPVFACFRPRCSMHGFGELHDAQILNPNEKLNGKSRVLIRQKIDPEVSVQSWLDPENRYLPVKFSYMLNSVPFEVYDIVYRFDENSNPIPERWRIVSTFKDKQLRSSVDATMVSVQASPDFDSKHFSFPFPPRTAYQDLTREQPASLPSNPQDPEEVKNDLTNSLILGCGFGLCFLYFLVMRKRRSSQ